MLVPLLGLKHFEEWVEAAMPEQLADGEDYCLQFVHGLFARGKEWRLEVGGALYKW